MVRWKCSGCKQACVLERAVMREPELCPYTGMVNDGWRELDINGKEVVP